MKEGKSFKITQHQMFEAYKSVKANRGAEGADGIDFEKNLKNNLYKLWNRMSSGSYFPTAVRGVYILRKIVECNY